VFNANEENSTEATPFVQDYEMYNSCLYSAGTDILKISFRCGDRESLDTLPTQMASVYGVICLEAPSKPTEKESIVFTKGEILENLPQYAIKLGFFFKDLTDGKLIQNLGSKYNFDVVKELEGNVTQTDWTVAGTSFFNSVDKLYEKITSTSCYTPRIGSEKKHVRPCIIQ